MKNVTTRFGVNPCGMGAMHSFNGLPVWASLAIALSLTNCGISLTLPGENSTSGDTVTGSDGTTPDDQGAGSDAAKPKDAQPGDDADDAQPDVAPDAAPDAAPDVGPDTDQDAAPDVAPDAAPDVIVVKTGGVIVRAQNGQGLSASTAQIELGGKKVAADSDGTATFTDVPVGAQIAKVTSAGYAEAAASITVVEGKTAFKTVTLSAVDKIVTVDPSQAVTVVTADVAIQVPAAGFVDKNGAPVTGPVQVAISTVDVGSADLASAPGALQTVSTSGVATQLQAAAMADISFTSWGEKVQLGAGQKADVSLAIPASTAGNYANGQMVKTYWYDTVTAAWKEGGAGTINVNGGSTSVAFQADHFTWWMAGEVIANPGCLTVKVTIAGIPAANASVTAIGQSYSGIGGGVTDDTGSICLSGAPSGTAAVMVEVAGASQTGPATATVGAGVCGAGSCSTVTVDLQPKAGCLHVTAKYDDGKPVAKGTIYFASNAINASVPTSATGEACGPGPLGYPLSVFASDGTGMSPIVDTNLSATAATCGGACTEVSLTIPVSATPTVVGDCGGFPDGTNCTDKDECTFGDKCVGGKCLGVPKTCDDGQACTVNSCNAVNGSCNFTAQAGCVPGQDCGQMLTCATACGGNAGCISNCQSSGSPIAKALFNAATTCATAACAGSSDPNCLYTATAACAAPFAMCSGADTDKDGTADAKDCAPTDATVFPGSAEMCDGKDNDCDGQIDEGDTGCASGTACTNGACVASTAPACFGNFQCDDGKTCTLDLCDPAKGCSHSPVAGCSACNTAGDCPAASDPCKSFQCTSDHVCLAVVLDPTKCTGGCTADAECNDGDGCTIDYCYQGKCGTKPDVSCLPPPNSCKSILDCTGQCVSQGKGTLLSCAATCEATADGPSKAFANALTSCMMAACPTSDMACFDSAMKTTCAQAKDACTACVSAADCNDGNPCTVDNCSPTKTCVSVPDNTLPNCGGTTSGNCMNEVNCYLSCVGGKTGGGASACGDGICQPDENQGSCPQDCSSMLCGNGKCEPNENPANCPMDCGTGMDAGGTSDSTAPADTAAPDAGVFDGGSTGGDPAVCSTQCGLAQDATALDLISCISAKCAPGDMACADQALSSSCSGAASQCGGGGSGPSCKSDAECDDKNTCTTELCAGGQCQYQSNPGGAGCGGGGADCAPVSQCIVGCASGLLGGGGSGADAGGTDAGTPVSCDVTCKNQGNSPSPAANALDSCLLANCPKMDSACINANTIAGGKCQSPFGACSVDPTCMNWVTCFGGCTQAQIAGGTDAGAADSGPADAGPAPDTAGADAGTGMSVAAAVNQCVTTCNAASSPSAGMAVDYANCVLGACGSDMTCINQANGQQCAPQYAQCMGGGGKQCTIAADCNDGNPCTDELCNAGNCNYMPSNGPGCNGGGSSMCNSEFNCTQACLSGGGTADTSGGGDPFPTCAPKCESSVPQLGPVGDSLLSCLHASCAPGDAPCLTKALTQNCAPVVSQCNSLDSAACDSLVSCFSGCYDAPDAGSADAGSMDVQAPTWADCEPKCKTGDPTGDAQMDALYACLKAACPTMDTTCAMDALKTSCGNEYGTCTQPVNGCTDSSSCNDGNACTTDSCVNSACQYASVPNCQPGTKSCDQVYACVVSCAPTVPPFGWAGSCMSKCGPSGDPAVDAAISSLVMCTQSACPTGDAVCMAAAQKGSCSTAFNKCVGGGPAGCSSDSQCNDGKPCTNDLCATATGMCSNEVIPACEATCTTAIDCDDGNTCTADSCTTGTCANTPIADGSSCTDGNTCTIADSCKGGACTAGASPPCDDGQSCTQDACDAVMGCVFNSLPDNFPCNDGNACTFSDMCKAMICAGQNTSCDDGNTCTMDACDAGMGCMHTPAQGAPCDDGNSCTANDICAAGSCTGMPVDADGDGFSICSGDCDDNDKNIHPGAMELCNGKDDNCDGMVDTAGSVGCTMLYQDKDGDTFGGQAGQCLCAAGGGFTALTNSDCDDGNASTHPGASELCNGQDDNCDGMVDNNATCDDGNLCTNDACTPLGSCINLPNASACDDFNPCTANDSCSSAVCVGGPAPTCDDFNECTMDICSPGFGCAHPTMANGTACSAGTCQQGVCAP